MTYTEVIAAMILNSRSCLPRRAASKQTSADNNQIVS
jgi:hypothetical protein